MPPPADRIREIRANMHPEAHWAIADWEGFSWHKGSNRLPDKTPAPFLTGFLHKRFGARSGVRIHGRQEQHLQGSWLILGFPKQSGRLLNYVWSSPIAKC